MRILKAMLLGAAMGGLTAAGAMAAGSGGSGAGSMPSASAPEYNPAAEYTKAVAALRAKDYKAAAQAATRVTSAVPKSVEGWKVLGVAQAGQEKWKESRKAYEHAVKLAPDDAQAHAGLGKALARLSDPKAQTELEWLKAKAAGCGDGCADGANLKAMVTEVEGAMTPTASAPAAGRQPAAAIESGLVLATEAAGDGAYLKAVGLINEKRYDEALASLKSSSAAFGPHPDILTYQGFAWRKKGQFARAEDYYRQALAIAPNHRGATEYYGELKVERGDLAGAKLMLAKLDAQCVYGCAEAEELRRWISAGGEPAR